MNDKDLILKTIISNPNINSNNFFTADSLKTVILKDKNLDEIEYLLKQITTERSELLEVKKVSGYRFSVFPTGLIESFLKKGGFAKIESDLKKKNDLELRKSKVDLELAEKMLEEFPKTKLLARLGFIIAIILMLKELYTLIWK